MDGHANTNDDGTANTVKEGVVYDLNIPGLSKLQVRDKYNQWTSYDKDIQTQDWQASHVTAAAVEEYCPASTRNNSKIIDVGAGTGLLGQELRKAGFTHIDALDPSSVMMDVARQRGVYDNYLEEFLSAKPLENIPQDSYDILTGSGCFEQNHIPSEALYEAIRIVKPGGMVFLTTKRLDNDYCKELYRLEDELQVQGKWKQIERSVKPVYRFGYECMLHVYRVV